MKALTLTQPYASLVVGGQKRWETRSWRTHHRGPLAIHAAQGFPRAARELCGHEPFARPLRALGYDGADALPHGVLLAVVRVRECRRVEEVRDGLGSAERAFGDYGDGRFAWRLDVLACFPAPLSARGSLGLWNVPDRLLASGLSEALGLA